MGLNFAYLLYFNRDRLWDVLYGLADISDSVGLQPTTIHFPDCDQILPLMTFSRKSHEIQYDAPEMDFALSLIFDEDQAILEYLSGLGDDISGRSPPGEGVVNRYAIGFIYLTVYADLSRHWAFKKPTDLVLFRFDTTGTRMSMLFDASISIRKTFTNLLERFQGVCGIFDHEVDVGELFYFKGQHLCEEILHVYTPPDEIETMLKRGW